MCNGIKIVRLGCEKQQKLAQKWPKNSHFPIFFDFLKNCPYDSNEIFYSHSTPYYGPLCAMASKSYGWDVGNIAKISSKMAKKQSFFDFFFDFIKNCPYDSNEIFYSHSTPYYGPLCAISLTSYGWDKRNSQNIPKMAKKPPFFDFLKLSIRFEQKFLVIFYTIVWSYVCYFNKFV